MLSDLKQDCFLCNQYLPEESVLRCLFSDKIDSKSKKVHFLCSLFFSELEFVRKTISSDPLIKGGEKIGSSNYLEDCKLCNAGTFGPCLIRCFSE